MPSASHHRLILTTAPDAATGRQLAETILQRKLAACVNIVPSVESWYWWDGRIEQANEVWLVIKTIDSNVTALEKHVVSVHPYDTPEFLSLPIDSGNRRYLDWITASVDTHHE